MPYAALVADHPVICDIHAKALEQVLAGTGQDIELESMDVFPGQAFVWLTFVDLTSYRPE